MERYGAPEMLVSDGAGVFKANQAKAVYRALGIRKETIEKRKPWQNFVETTFNIQRRMAADYHFAKAESWEGLVAVHDRWVERYNTQSKPSHGRCYAYPSRERQKSMPRPGLCGRPETTGALRRHPGLGRGPRRSPVRSFFIFRGA